MDGIVLINKPRGITSYDVIRQAKKVFKTKKIGHTGTLDPFAEGLMILCVEKCTKLSNKFLNSDKRYDGTIIFGNHYDTYDTTGKIVSSNDLIVNYNDVLQQANSLVGNYKQLPPIYSAIKVDGKKLYEYARNNIDVDIKKRDVTIYEFNINDINKENIYTFSSHVSKGTYIRSLAVDLAERLNTVGALDRLKRVSIGNFNINDAVNLEDLSIDNIIGIEDIYVNSPKLILSDYIIKLVRNGIYLDERQIVTNEDFLVYDSNNNLVAVYEVVDTNKYRPLIIL